MPELPAPALRGNDPLGFLAALGVLSLAEQESIAPVCLAWQGGIVPHAVFHSETYQSLSDLARDLKQVAVTLHQQRAAIPALPPHFPYLQRHPKDTTTGADPMRMSREAATATYLEADQHWHNGNPWFARWLIALLGLGTLDDKGAVRLTPFNAPFGQMKFRDSYFDQACNYVATRPEMPADAFTGWVRLNNYTGANLDERALRDAPATTNGRPANTGAPSPTWLATMAFRFFPLVDDGRIKCTAWQDVRLYPGATRRSLIWPLWNIPLDPPAVRALLSHPALALQPTARGRHTPLGRAQLPALRIFALYGASRKTRTQGDGPLGPAVLIWPPRT